LDSGANRGLYGGRLKFYVEVSENVDVWADWRFSLLFGSDDGKDLLEYVNERIENGMDIAEEHEEPEQLESTRVLMEIFWDLSRFRTSNGMGPNSITLTDIDAYCRYSNLVLKWIEIQWIKQIDSLYLKHYKAPKSDGN